MEKLGSQYRMEEYTYSTKVIDTAYIVKLSVEEYEALVSLGSIGGDLATALGVATKLLEAHKQLHPELQETEKPRTTGKAKKR